jgi:hypothetical protein
MRRRPLTPLDRFDPASLGDPVATRTSWKPLRKGGTNVCLHRLSSRGPDRLGFRPTVIGVLGPLLVMGLGGGVMAAIPSLPVADAHYLFAFFAMILIGPGAFLLGARMLLWTVQPRVFDRRRGVLARGWSPSIDLARIHALQIITEVCTTKSTPFFSYELNLVLADGERVNLLDHGDLPQLRKDAATLSAFTGLPLWDPR